MIMSFYYTSDSLWNSDWSRAFNQFTIACELDMINAISGADIAFIMSSSRSAWLLSPLEISPQKQDGWMLCFCFWGWIMWKMFKVPMKWNFSPLFYIRKLRSMLHWFIIFEFGLHRSAYKFFLELQSWPNSSQNVRHSARSQNMQISTVDIIRCVKLSSHHSIWGE